MKRKGALTILAFMFALCGVLSLMSIQKLSESDGISQASVSSDLVWDGTYPETEPDPTDLYISGSTYEIYTAKGFAYFAGKVNSNSGAQNFLNKTISLKADIDLNGYSWTPIGYESAKAFRGTFNGNNHYIYNLNLSGNYDALGLFGFIGNGGSVKNLNVSNLVISGTGTNVGGVAGHIFASAGDSVSLANTPIVLSNCSVSGYINSLNATNIGGVVGTVSALTEVAGYFSVKNRMENLKSSVKILTSTSSSNVGGIVGSYAGLWISNSAYDGAMTGVRGNIGGIVGKNMRNVNKTTFQHIYNTGDISTIVNSNATDNVGGLIGRSENSASGNKIEYSYNGGNLSPLYGYVGGLIGYVGSTVDYEVYAISNCFNAGEVKNTTTSISTGGSAITRTLLFYQNSNVVTTSRVYNTASITSGEHNVKELSSWAKSKGMYLNENLWGDGDGFDSDFDSVWDISTSLNKSFPYLRILENRENKNVVYETKRIVNNNGTYEIVVADSLEGSGTELDPYRIYTAKDLSMISTHMSASQTKYFSLQNDIDLSKRSWIPILNFSGVIDGNGHTIYGLTSSTQSQFNASSFGIFGSTKNAIIKNLNIKDVKYVSSQKRGAIIGSVADTTYLVNCTVEKNDENIVPVGEYTSTNLHVYLGKANLQNKENDLIYSTYAPKGYVVEINANGGKIYQKQSATETIIPGKYNILVKMNGDLSNATSFQPQILPRLSSDNANIYIVNEGHKLTKYHTAEYYDANGQHTDNGRERSVGATSFEAIASKADLKIDDLSYFAEYEEKEIAVKLYYNAYEYAAGFTNQLDYSEKSFGYDEIINEVWPDIFNATRENYVNRLANTSGGYDYDYFENFDSATKVFSERLDGSQRVNGNLEEKNVYIKWTGTSTKNYEFTINFSKYINADVHAQDLDEKAKSRFNIRDVVKSVKLLAYANTSEEVTEMWTGAWSGDDYVISFNTKYSDLDTNRIKIAIEVKEGYFIDFASLQRDSYAGARINSDVGGESILYGKTKASENFDASGFINYYMLENSTEDAVENALEALSFYNLSDDFSVSVRLERKIYEKEITASGDFAFGVGPKYRVKNIKSASDAGDGISLTGSPYVGYDFVNGGFLKTTREYGSILPTFFGGEFIVVDENNVKRYYRVDFNDIYGSDGITLTGKEGILYELSSNEAISDTIVKLVYNIEQDSNTGNDIYVLSMFKYFYDADFIFVFSTENDDDMFVDYTVNFTGLDEHYKIVNVNPGKNIQEDPEGDPIYVEEEITPDMEGGTPYISKGYAVFSNALQYGGNEDTFRLASDLTRIILRFELLDEEGNVLNEKQPSLRMNKRIYNVSSDGEIKFFVDPSKYYKFKQISTNTIVINDGTNGNIEIYQVGDENPYQEEYAYDAVRSSFDTQTNINQVTLKYGSGLVAGNYVIKVYCEEVFYKLTPSVTIGGLASSNMSFEVYSAGFTNDSTPPADSEFSEIDYNQRVLRYNDWVRVVVKTPLVSGEGASAVYNKAYYMKWWNVGDNHMKLENSDDGVMTYTFRYYQVYDACECTGNEINLNAEFLRKEIDLELYEGYVWDETQIRTTGYLGIDVMIDDSTVGLKEYSATLANTAYKNVRFENIDGENAEGFYYDGYKIFYIGDNGLEEIFSLENRVVASTYDLSGLISRIVSREEEYVGKTSQTYLILPAVKRKNVTLNFYSGTGTAQGKYGDGREGIVRDLDNVETITTNTKLTYTSVYGQTFNITNPANYGSSTTGRNILNVFATREGYTRGTNQYLTYLNQNVALSNKYFIQENEIDLNKTLLSYATATIDQETNIKVGFELNFFFTWTPNDYTITFNENEGEFSSGDAVLQVLFDRQVTGIPQVSRVGYTFTGWRWFVSDEDTEGQEAISESGEFVNETLFDDLRNYVYQGDITLVAQWEEKTYLIRVYQNGANEYYKNGTRKTTSETDTYEEYEINYNATLTNLLADYSGVKIPLRRDYTFKGLYLDSSAFDENNKVESETIFNVSLPTCHLREGDVSLELFAAWEFSGDYSISFNDSIDAKDYIASSQTIYIGDFLYKDDLTNQYVYSGYQNVSFNSLTGALNITLSDDTHSSITTNLDGRDAVSFDVRNAGTHIVTFTILIEDDAPYFNQGLVFEENHVLSVEVLKASLDANASIVNEKRKLANVKKIMKNLISEDDYDDIKDLGSLNTFASYIKTKDSTASDATVDDIYNFVMTKYYFQLTGVDYNLYRNWTYEQFDDYFTNNSDYVEEIVNKLRFIDFYNYEETSGRRTITDYDQAVSLKSVDNLVSAADLNNELTISAIKIEGGGQTIPANIQCSLRVYVSNIDVEMLNNYNLQTDDEDKKYFELAQIYILPQVIEVSNSPDSSYCYYSDSVAYASVDWSNGKNEATIYQNRFFEIADNIYMSGELVTSNAGDGNVDTQYTCFGEENYMYFKNVSVCRSVDGGYDDYTSRFKVLVNKDDIFEIRSTKDFILITVKAKYLTINNGAREISDISEDVVSGLLRIVNVAYYTGSNVDAQTDPTRWTQIRDDNYIEEGSYTDGHGLTLFEMYKNSANEVKIFVNKVVKRISVVLTTNSISRNVIFYKWSQEEENDIGEFEQNGGFDIYVADIEDADNGANTAEYYAIFTDLVEVVYKLNFPEDYETHSIKRSVLKLGESTIENLIIPNEGGFEFDGFRLVDTDGRQINYESLFDSTTGLFKGLSNPHSRVELDVKWKIGEIQYTQLQDDVYQRVGSLTDYELREIVEVENTNDTLFNYTYTWKKGTQIVCETENLTLEHGGLTTDSGAYTITISASVKDHFASVVADNTDPETVVLSFNLTLVPHKIVSVELSGSDTGVYDSLDHAQDWSLLVEYHRYDNETRDYFESSEIERLFYSSTGLLTATLKSGGEKVMEAYNAGQYDIIFDYNTDYYIVDASADIETEYTYTLRPYELEISNLLTAKTKRFNADNVDIMQTVDSGFEDVELKFVRQAGEDVGSYNLYFNDITSQNRKNYTILYNSTKVFENLVANGSVVVGQFTITTTGELVLSYEPTALISENIVVDYDTDGYTLNLTNNFVLEIYNGETKVKSVQLNLYDVANEKEVSNATVLNILSTKVADITPYFYASSQELTAILSGRYVYTFEMGDIISDYFSAINFKEGYQFTIKKNEIDVSLFNLNKVYDGERYEYVDLSGNFISSIDDYEDVYIAAVYESAYVGTNIKVSLTLVSNGVDNLSNYELSALTTTANITKLAATGTFDTTEDDYVYGTVRQNNFEDYIEDIVLTANEENVNPLLVQGRYRISFALAPTSAANPDGCLYAGNHTVVVTASFDDFDVTITAPIITVTALEIEKSFARGTYKRVVGTIANLGPYSENYLVAETGDTIQLDYYIAGVSSVNQLEALHFYDFELPVSNYANNSIIVTIEEDNEAFEVLANTDVISMHIDNTAGYLTKTYDGQDFTLSVDLANLKLQVSYGATTQNLNISFEDEHGNPKTITDLSELRIFYLAAGVNGGTVEQTVFNQAGSYKLNMVALSNSYPSILFDTDYYFTINKVSINVSALSISKTYDGTQTYVLSNFAGKVSGDDVEIVGAFADSSVGNGKTINLSLRGADSINYALSASTTTGDIVKQTANVEITNYEYTFGELSNGSRLGFTVKHNGDAVSTTEYNVAFEIVGATYSTGGYLNVGRYNLNMTGTSANYNLVYSSTEKLVVSKYSLDVEFNTSGQVSVEYGLTNSNKFNITYRTPLLEDIVLEVTKANGTDVGYYRALSAEPADANSNYQVNHTTDNSDGVYRIVKSSKTVYLLLASDNIVTDLNAEQVVVEYDGTNYNTISVEVDSGDIKLVVSDGTESKRFNLNKYFFDGEKYTKTTENLQNLTSETRFLDYEEIKNVGVYRYLCSAISATNYQVSLMKENVVYNTLQITPRALYFIEDTITKTFNNQEAVYEYEDATEIVERIVEGDEIGITIEFLSGANRAVYAGTGYTVEGTLVGDSTLLANYIIPTETQLHSAVEGIIEKAQMKIIINSIVQVYGLNVTPTYTYEYDTEVIDLTGYDTTRISIELSISNEEFSSSNCLKVGQYSILVDCTLQDFEEKYVVDGDEFDDYQNDASITITGRELAYSAATGVLGDVFKKKYDGNTSCVIDDGSPLLTISNVVTGDTVYIESAEYASSDIGNSIAVTFTLAGTDAENYSIPSWSYGVIEPVVIELRFDYNAGGSSSVHSNVEEAGLLTIKDLAFPFVSVSFLTSNSYDDQRNQMQNFPTSLSGYTGYSFKAWTLDFDNVVENSQKHEFLSALAESLSLNSTYDDQTEIFKYYVGNNAATVSLLNSLIRDDTNNIAGMYYLEDDYYVIGEKPRVIFKAEWAPVEYLVSIRIADDKGKTAPYGTVTVNGDLIDRSGSVTFGYLDAVEVIATPANHCRYYAFYDADEGFRYDVVSVPFVEVVSSGNSATLTISQMTKSYNIVVRFKAQAVNVNIDTTNAANTTTYMEEFVEGDNVLSWQTNYFALGETTLDDIGIERVGYELTSISDGTTTYLPADFDSIVLADLVSGNLDTTITLTPTFESVGVVVTLDYNYGGITELIAVDFERPYSASAGWVETPEREGYEFGGWYTDDSFEQSKLVTGETIVSTTNEHTLIAKWTIAQFTLHINFENMKAVVGGEELAVYEEEITYNEQVMITIVADDGYSVPNAASLPQGMTLATIGGAKALIYTMPGQDKTFTISARAKANTVTYSGQHISSVVAYDITEGEDPISVSENSFEVETGRIVRIVVTAEAGYWMQDFEASDENLDITELTSEGVMTLEVLGINSDVEFAFSTKESKHTVEITFDDTSEIKNIVSDGTNYFDFENLSFVVFVGDDLQFNVQYNHGYRIGQYQTQDGYTVSVEETTLDDELYYQVTISNVLTDGSVSFTTQIESYTLTLEVVSYDENKQVVVEERNRVAISENGRTTYTNEFGTEITLEVVSSEAIYSFAGWSKNGINVFDTQEEAAYTISDNETIYAIFSAIRFNITLKTYEYYTLYGEYDDDERKEEHFDLLENVGEGYFEDEDFTIDASELKIYYGSSKNIYYKEPAGYRFYGYGYLDGRNFVYIYKDDGNSMSYITISTLDLDEDNTTITLYFVVRALSSKVDFKTEIDINGEKENNEDVGTIELVDKNGNSVNEFGYIEGKRTHYTEDSFVNGELLNNRRFSVLGYTSEEIYIKVVVEKEGYRLLDMISDSEYISIVRLVDEDDYTIYRIRGIVGGIDNQITVQFRPNLNKIYVDFNAGKGEIDGGSFNYTTEQQTRVFSAGVGYSHIEMSAYTDSSFRIYAYVDMGYVVDENDIQFVDENNLVVDGSVTYQQSDIFSTGYTCLITFEVKGFLGENTIELRLTPRTYTVHLIEDGTKLVTIRNVEYNTYLNFEQSNSDNITIYDNRFVYAGGKLNLKLNKQNYTYEGFFSYENGAGVRYINSEGLASMFWQETGYYYDVGSSTYKRAENAYIDEQSGEIEVSLFLYWSYLKTRITFTLVPSISTPKTAEDMIEGIDETNSWFYKTAPYYIEIAFNTSIKITAPDLDGYKFYKFIVSQKNRNGEWLSDVSTTSQTIPWETNELDGIVEVNIQVVYFSKIDVIVYGGEGAYEIRQLIDDVQAQKLIRESYVDSTTPFTLIAVPEKGYTFTRWNNITSGKSSIYQEWEGLYINTKSTFVMNLQGDYVTLRFMQLDEGGNEVPYDYTHGQILGATAVSINNTTKSFRIGAKVRDNFTILMNEIEVKVGDVLTFETTIDYGYAAIWNREDISYNRYSNGKYYFDLEIVAEMSETAFVRLIPSFRNEVLSIYVKTDFAEDQKGLNAVDNDNVNAAGYVTYESRRVKSMKISRGRAAEFGVVVNTRYAIESITISRGDVVFDIMQFYKNGKVSLEASYIEENEIVGTLGLKVIYTRLLWDEKQVSVSLSGEGTSRNPYEIKTVEELVFVMQMVNSGAKNSYGKYYAQASYLLKKDLKIDEMFWTPIGTIEHPFDGQFNFNKHKVEGIHNPFLFEETSYDGLFGVIGLNAEILAGKPQTWYWYLIAVAIISLGVTAGLTIYTAKKRGKRREKMSVK